jgi:hypothetical protein
MTKTPKIEQLDITALTHRPAHLEAMGTFAVEITHMERALSEMLGIIMGTHFAVAEVIYFTVNSAIGRMDIVRNIAELVLVSLPKDRKKVISLVERGKAVMGRRHAVIHSFWMLGDTPDAIRSEKLGEFRNKRIGVLSLKDLKQQVRSVQVLTNEIYAFCREFGSAHPSKVDTLRDYW